MNAQATADIENYGQIKRIVAPDNWKTIERRVPKSASLSWISIGPTDAPGVEICACFRGRPLAAAGQENLKTVIEMPLGDLNATQIESLEETLGDASIKDAFEFQQVFTQEWNGRRVLRVEGRWNQSRTNRLWLFVPINANCDAVQEIWFQAPVETYANYLPAALDALQSVEWKARN